MPAPITDAHDSEPTSIAADDAEISEVLESIDASGAKVKVYRKHQGSQKYAYVDEYPTEGFTVETLKSTYGGGDYRLGIHDGKGRRIKRVDLFIDPRIKGTLDQPAVLPAVTPIQSNDTLIQLMNQQQQSAQQMLILMMQSQQQQAQQMTQVLVAALTGAKAPTSTSPGEPASRMLEAMMPLLLANVQKTAGPAGSMKEQIETLRALKELLPDGGKEEKEEDMIDKIMKIGGPVMAGLIGMRGGGMSMPQALPEVTVAPRPAPQQAAQPAPAAPPEPPQPKGGMQNLTPDVQQMILSLRQFTPVLVNAAHQDGECLSYYNLVADLLTDAQYDQLVEILRRDDWTTVLFADDAGVLQYKPWFENLRDTFLNPEAYTDDAPTPDAAPGAAGQPGAASLPTAQPAH